MWRAGLMDAVASRDEVETAVGIKFTGRLSVKLQVRTNTFCRGARARPRDRVLVWIDRCDDAELGKVARIELITAVCWRMNRWRVR